MLYIYIYAAHFRLSLICGERQKCWVCTKTLLQYFTKMFKLEILQACMKVCAAPAIIFSDYHTLAITFIKMLHWMHFQLAYMCISKNMKHFYFYYWLRNTTLLFSITKQMALIYIFIFLSKKALTKIHLKALTGKPDYKRITINTI